MRLLNVGGNSKDIPIPKFYDGWEHHLLDIDPIGNPDICCDAQLLKDKIELAGQYDSVYCSHNLEHYYRHKVKDVLAGCNLVLNDDGFCYIAVPDMMAVLRRVVAYNMELTDTLYTLDDGTVIMPHDVMYGWGKQIKRSGVEFFAHKCAFTPKMLTDDLKNAGFNYIYLIGGDLNLTALAFKKEATNDIVSRIMSN